MNVCGCGEVDRDVAVLGIAVAVLREGIPPHHRTRTAPSPHQLRAVAEGVIGADLAGLAGQAIEVAGVAAHTQDALVGAVLADAALTDVQPDLPEG